jgi:hypothetical protein
MICLTCPNKGESEEAYRERLAAYLSSHPEEIKTPPAEYENRLAVCRDCGELMGATCLECGCYMKMRAAKRVMGCPDGKWEVYCG